MAAPALRVRLWGVRGSVPAPGAATRRFGGNTACVSARTPNGRRIVLDAGTGARPLGDDLLLGSRSLAHGDAGHDAEPLDVDVFLTHAHWDHLQGLPFFAPLYAPHARVTLHTPPDLAAAVELVVRNQMRPPAFPVSFDALPATVTFRVVPSEGVAVDDVRVRALAAYHPGGAAGWRLESSTGDALLAYLPDNELSGAPRASPIREAWVSSIRGARLLIHDATYTPDELPDRGGWGHSSWDEAVRLAVESEVERLVLFHHHPDRNDGAVERIVGDARALVASLGSAVRVVAAAEGLVLHV